MLNKEQLAAANDIDGTSIIIAGAGTGKTQTLIHKLVNLLNKGVDPARICLLTFTNDAAKTMKERALKLGANNIDKIVACTYHSFCDRLMRHYNHLINRSNKYTILEPSMACDIISMQLNDYKKDLRNMGIKTPSAKTIAGIFSASINQDVPLKDIVYNNPTLQKACNHNKDCMDYLYQTLYVLRENVQEYKEMHDMKDFDDLLTGTYDLLNDKIVRDMVNLLYEYILIDEYQDTNPIQAEIVHLLRDTNTNLVVVGDDYQSIYKFRGANVANFTNFPNEFENVHEHKLVQNYRSTQEILDLANSVMDNNATFGFKKTLVSGLNKHGSKPILHIVDDQRKEAKLVYKMILKYLKTDPTHKTAILYRNSNSVAYLEAELRKNNYEYEKHGGVAFFDMECIQDVLSYLRVIVQPFNELAWYRIFKIYGHIGDKRATTMSSKCGDLDFLQKLNERHGNSKTAKDIDNDLTLLETVLDELHQLETTYDMLNVIIKHYKEIYGRRAENNTSMDENKDSVFAYLDTLLELSNNEEYKNVVKWLDATTLKEVDKPNDAQQIVLSTIHSAKGLEWNHVIILDCVDNIFPSEKSKSDKDELDEELRCFYVAITRAADTLDLMCPSNISIFGRLSAGRISPFLDKADKNVYEKQNCRVEVGKTLR